MVFATVPLTFATSLMFAKSPSFRVLVSAVIKRKATTKITTPTTNFIGSPKGNKKTVK